MKRYALFAGSYYYPSGGSKDLVGLFDSIEECRAEDNVTEHHGDGSNSLWDWAHICDTENDLKQIMWMEKVDYRDLVMWTDIENTNERRLYFAEKERELQGLPRL